MPSVRLEEVAEQQEGRLVFLLKGNMAVDAGAGHARNGTAWHGPTKTQTGSPKTNGSPDERRQTSLLACSTLTRYDGHV